MFVILLKSTSMNQGYPKIMIKPDINLFFKNILTNKSGNVKSTDSCEPLIKLHLKYKIISS
jgi:hypothetical protein